MRRHPDLRHHSFKRNADTLNVLYTAVSHTQPPLQPTPKQQVLRGMRVPPQKGVGETERTMANVKAG